RPRRRRPGVRSRLGRASRSGSSAPPLGAVRWPSGPGAPRRRPARSLSGIRADRARSWRSAAAPAVDSGVPSEVCRRADGDGAADRQSPARHRIGGGARRRDRAGGDRLGRPGPGAHAPGCRAHGRAGAARATAARGVAVRMVERVSRFACLWVECFAAAAAERSEPALRGAPLAVVAPAPSVTRVVDANAAAREYGVRAGVTETEARARCPALVTRSFSEAHVRSARHALLEAALGVSPRVEDAGAGLVYVDAVGLTWLHGDPAAIGRRLWSQARAVGFPGCRVALAGSRTAARVAALNATEPVTVIPPGEERAALAAAPLAVLGLAPALAVTLEGWAVRAVGALASGGHHARAVALAVPMREPKPMLALLTLDLEAHPPSAAVTRATISARPVRVPAGQGGLWQPPAPRLRDLVAVLARLAVLVGP